MITLMLELGEPGSPSADFLNPIELIITPSFSWIDAVGYTDLSGTVTTTGAAITSVEYKVGSGSYSAVSTFSAPNWSNATTTLVEGMNTITVKATDADGKYIEKTLLIAVDLTDPVVTLGDDQENEGTGYTVVLTSANFIETNPDTVRYKVEGGALSGDWVTWDSPYSNQSVHIPADGDNAYNVTLEVTDLSGRTASDEQLFYIGYVYTAAWTNYTNEWINYTGAWA